MVSKANITFICLLGGFIVIVGITAGFLPQRRNYPDTDQGQKDYDSTNKKIKGILITLAIFAGLTIIAWVIYAIVMHGKSETKEESAGGETLLNE